MALVRPPEIISPKRRQLCSREHALRVAARIFDACAGPVSIVRTCDPLQPYRVSTSPDRRDTVELEMVS
ncbi:MAG: hypothetical protein QHC67_15190 [Sphingobium sp.]|uniref:hypothetical protein n=1 Tax=Sphingobium sp. TaxID=1912891 RepID=UPI0029B02147|nr:hypothetical protein [Sphingobium sp.]MDX3911144.1 hypothetical protein [Sphingobium sp.]